MNLQIQQLRLLNSERLKTIQTIPRLSSVSRKKDITLKNFK